LAVRESLEGAGWERYQMVVRGERVKRGKEEEGEDVLVEVEGKNEKKRTTKNTTTTTKRTGLGPGTTKKSR
jgi:hypothetical protein